MVVSGQLTRPNVVESMLGSHGAKKAVKSDSAGTIRVSRARRGCSGRASDSPEQKQSQPPSAELQLARLLSPHIAFPSNRPPDDRRKSAHVENQICPPYGTPLPGTGRLSSGRPLNGDRPGRQGWPESNLSQRATAPGPHTIRTSTLQNLRGRGSNPRLSRT